MKRSLFLLTTYVYVLLCVVRADGASTHPKASEPLNLRNAFETPNTTELSPKSKGVDVCIVNSTNLTSANASTFPNTTTLFPKDANTVEVKKNKGEAFSASRSSNGGNVETLVHDEVKDFGDAEDSRDNAEDEVDEAEEDPEDGVEEEGGEDEWDEEEKVDGENEENEEDEESEGDEVNEGGEGDEGDEVNEEASEED